MKKIIYLVIAVAILFFVASNMGATDVPGATKTLERNGYKPISVGGYDWGGGSDNDVYKTHFKAVAQNGDTVEGCVTRGWRKGNTIRLN